MEILKKYSGYDTSVESKKYSAAFVLDNKTSGILLKYDYLKYSGRPHVNEDDIVFAMLDFVCDHFMYGGNVRLPRDHSIAGIIKGSEKTGFKTNCSRNRTDSKGIYDGKICKEGKICNRSNYVLENLIR